MRPALAKPQQKIYYNVKTGQYLQFNSSTRQYYICAPPQLHPQHGAHRPQRPPNVSHSTQQSPRPQQPSRRPSHTAGQSQRPPNTFQRFQFTPQQNTSKPRENELKHSSRVARKENPESVHVQHQMRPVPGSVPQTQIFPSSQHQRQPNLQQKHGMHDHHHQQQQQQQHAQQLKKEHQVPPLLGISDQSKQKTSHTHHEKTHGNRSASKHSPKPGSSTSGFMESSIDPKCESTSVNSNFTSKQAQSLKKEHQPQAHRDISGHSKQKPLHSDHGKTHEGRSTFEHSAKAGTSTSVVSSIGPEHDSTSVNSSSTQPPRSVSPRTTSTAPTSSAELETVGTQSAKTTVESSKVVQLPSSDEIGSAKIISEIMNTVNEKSGYVGCLNSLHIGSLCIASGPAHLNKGPKNLSKGVSVTTVGGSSCVPSGSKKLDMGPAQLAKGPSVVTAGPNHKFSGPGGLSKGPAGLASGSHGILRSPSSVTVGPSVIPTGPSSASDLVGKTLAVGSANTAKGPSCSVRGPMKTVTYACNVELVRG